MPTVVYTAFTFMWVHIYLHNVFWLIASLHFYVKMVAQIVLLPIVICSINRQALLPMFCTKLLSIFLGDIDTKKHYCHLILSRKSIQAVPTQENSINLKQIGYSTEIFHRQSQTWNLIIQTLMRFYLSGATNIVHMSAVSCWFMNKYQHNNSTIFQKLFLSKGLH